MPFTLSQLRSQDIRDIDSFYAQANARNDRRDCSYAAFMEEMSSADAKEDNNSFKTSTQVSTDPGVLNAENCINEPKIKKKHKKNRSLEGNTGGESVLQDSESSCTTESSSKSKKKKHKNPLDTEHALNENHSESSCTIKSISKTFSQLRSQDIRDIDNFYAQANARNDNCVLSFDTTPKSVTVKRKWKEVGHSENIADLSKHKRKCSQNSSENNLENDSVFLNTSNIDSFNSEISTGNGKGLNDFVMPKNLKVEEDNSFTTDSDLLDSYLYFSYKSEHSNKKKKKKKKDRTNSVPMPIVIKTENDLDEEELHIQNATQDHSPDSDRLVKSATKKQKKKRKDYSDDKDTNEMSSETESVKNKHKNKEVENEFLEQIISSNNDRQKHNNAYQSREDHVKRKKKCRDYLNDKDYSDTCSYGETKSVRKKNKNRTLQNDLDVNEYLEERYPEQITSSKNVREKHENALLTEEGNDKYENGHKKYLDEEDNDVCNAWTENVKKKHKKKHKNQDKLDDNNKRHKKKHKDASYGKEDDGEGQQINNSTVKRKHTSKHRHEVVTNVIQENDESYAAFKNVLLHQMHDEAINSECDRKPKKHKKRSKDVHEKHSDLALVMRQENFGDLVYESDCKRDEFKQRNKKKSKIKEEDLEVESHVNLEPLIELHLAEEDQSFSSDGPDDRFYVKKKIRKISNFEGGIRTPTYASLGLYNTVTEDITGISADQSEVKNDVINESPYREKNDIVNAFKEKLSVVSKQISAESLEQLDAHKKSKTLSLTINLSFTQTECGVQDCAEVNCVNSKLLPGCVISPADTKDCTKANSEENEKLPEREESKVNSATNVPHEDYPNLNSEDNKKLPDCEQSQVILPSDVIEHNFKDYTEVNVDGDKQLSEDTELPTDLKIQPEVDAADNKSVEVEEIASGNLKNIRISVVDCEDDPETVLEFQTSSEITSENLYICANVVSNSSSAQKSKTVRILHNVLLTPPKAHTELVSAANDIVEEINRSHLSENNISDGIMNLYPMEKINEEHNAEEFNANNADRDNNLSEMLNAEIQAINSERHGEELIIECGEGQQKLTIFDEDTVVLSPNRKECAHLFTAFTGVLTSNNEDEGKKLETASMIVKDTNVAQKETNKEVNCKKELIFSKETHEENTPNTTTSSSATCMKDVSTLFKDLDISYLPSDSDSVDSQKESAGTSRSKRTSRHTNALYNRLMCSIEGDETATAEDIIDEALEHAHETITHIAEENKFLKDLVIRIPWRIPLAHTIETRMSSRPSPSQRKQFEELKIPLKLGPYTKEEDKIIVGNFAEFCKVHDVPHEAKPFLSFKHGAKTLLSLKQRVNFVQYLGKDLDCRMLHSIYRRFTCLFAEKKKGRFNEQEDAVIQKYVNGRNKSDSNKFSTLSKILNRDRLAVEKRYKYILSKQKLRKDDYKIREHIPEYLQCLMDILDVKEVGQLKEANMKRPVWLKLAEKLRQSETKVKRLWETIIYPRLFAENPIDTDSMMKQVVAKLVALKKTDYRDVNWSDVASEFKNVTPAYLYQMFKRLTNICVPEHKRHNLSSTLKCLVRAYEEDGGIMRTQSKIEFKNGEVSFITDS